MGFAIGPAEGRTCCLNPSYDQGRTAGDSSFIPRARHIR
jgi:hypothetical protein